jgi:hypothetical protein
MPNLPNWPKKTYRKMPPSEAMMKFQNALTAALAASTLCFATMALQGRTSAQGGAIKDGSSNTIAVPDRLVTIPTANAVALIGDDRYLWVAQPGQLHRVDRTSLSVYPIALPSAKVRIGPINESDVRIEPRRN